MFGTLFYLPGRFVPPVIAFNAEPSCHHFRFSLDTGSPRATELSRISILVRSPDRIRSYSDGTQLYRCTFEATPQIARVASGLCRA